MTIFCPICGSKLPAQSPHRNRVCWGCDAMAVNGAGQSASKKRVEACDNPVFIQERQCWRQYRVGGSYITFLDDLLCESWEEFEERSLKLRSDPAWVAMEKASTALPFSPGAQAFQTFAQTQLLQSHPADENAWVDIPAELANASVKKLESLLKKTSRLIIEEEVQIEGLDADAVHRSRLSKGRFLTEYVDDAAGLGAGFFVRDGSLGAVFLILNADVISWEATTLFMRQHGDALIHPDRIKEVPREIRYWGAQLAVPLGDSVGFVQRRFLIRERA
jgi:hypothetical protein